ncbi:MAG TPA: 1,6-anhydro-N-acetylmuramyl-L-alanine amidase AmpD [Gammaproteobacteria bacterium]|nr:1,6-anhydro-N-acetylmuramyl-L-alanine amidase AmpD [Gammaproteobacteria bacterium]
MKIDVDSGLLTGTVQVPSPNHDERPEGVEPELLVIHNISLPPGSFGGHAIDDLFCNRLDPEADPFFAEICQLKVSSHLLIRRDGEVVQYVPFQKRAWHAGISSYQGRPSCNDFSIGIELEGTDDSGFTARQYAVLAVVARQLFDAYPGLSAERMVGHSDIAPGRKTDPGPGFDWQRLKVLLSSSA